MLKLKFYIVLVFIGLTINSCNKDENKLEDITNPTNLTIEAVIQGQDATNPNGDGSGNVVFNVNADNAFKYHISFDTNAQYEPMTSNSITHKFTTLGLKTYYVTVKAFNTAGNTTTNSIPVKVQFNYEPSAAIITNLTNNASKTWIVDKSVPGHFGVGPWADTRTPSWWAASINEKVACCNCFYTTTFKFTKSGSNYSLQVTNPDGAFTKTGSLTNLPGIPSSGDEGCYSYSGGTNSFSFIPTASNHDDSTNTQIQLTGNNIYIGYGSLQNTYEIMNLEPNYMYLRVQGTETGNAWYIKMIPQP